MKQALKRIDLVAKLGQDGSSLQAMNALRVIRALLNALTKAAGSN
ncbi:hypothetical protein [Pseudomonas phage vB_Pae_BR200a]|nr:hypothetical protein [Pseudomonas phage vB_Pae_BR200a]